eukprot:sb/3476283/
MAMGLEEDGGGEHSDFHVTEGSREKRGSNSETTRDMSNVEIMKHNAKVLERKYIELSILVDKSQFAVFVGCTLYNVQSDPDLVTSSGERVLVTKSGLALNRGQIPLISFYPVTKSGCH